MMRFKSDNERDFWSEVFGYVIDGHGFSVVDAAKLADDSVEERRKRTEGESMLGSLGTPIKSLEVSVRARNCVESLFPMFLHERLTVRDLVGRCSPEEFLKVRSAGKETTRELVDCLASMGLDWRALSAT
jgi:DNA-directed RNA polymerase alpha subunit